MTISDLEIWDIVEKVLFGNPTTEEAKILEDWLAKSKENKKAFELFKKIGLKTPENFNELKANAYYKIRTAITDEKKSRKIIIWKYSAVASFALLIAFSVLTIIHQANSNRNTAYIETYIPYGQKSKVTLSDNTVVYLNSGSYLKYPVQFNSDSRSVTLKGEAFFEVAKDIEHPFIVQAGNLNIKVFGTRFNVKSYPDDEILETTLLEGSVGIMDKARNETIRLKPNQKAVYDSKACKMELQSVNAKLEIAWIEGKYYFMEETLTIITKKLERSFNVPIRIASEELVNRKFAGMFDKTKTIYQILNFMKRHNDFTYKVNNDTIVIYSKKKHSEQ